MMSILKKCLIVSLLFFVFYGCDREIERITNEIGIDSLSLYSFDKGVKEWELFTMKARGAYDSDTIFLYGVSIFYNNGVKIEARRGMYDQRTGDLFLEDSVIIITEMDDTIYTDSVFYDRERDLIRSDSKVLIRGNHRILEGSGFVSDNGFNKVIVRGKVCVKSY